MSKYNNRYFSRQEKIPWFSQDKIGSSILSILGIGGIGCNIALLATRIGFKKIILVDYDIVEASNLNRQTLYSKNDIGKNKADVAKNTLDNLDNLSSEIVAYNYDIFEDWQKTIEIVKESDFIMNSLDLPEIKRSLVGILCLKLGKPMIYSGTDPFSGYSGMILYQASDGNKPCYECLQAILCSVWDKHKVKKFSQDNILSFERIDWKELESRDFKNLEFGATIILTAMVSSTLAVNILIQAIHRKDCPNRIIFDLFSNTLESYLLEKREDCLVC